MKDCYCGAEDCWDRDDFTWVDPSSGWHGVSESGLTASVYFVHGKKIAEERHIPEFQCSIEQVPALLARWSAGMVSPTLSWSHDTGGGDSSLWLRDVREPSEEDWKRLARTRERREQEARQQYEKLKNKFGEAGR